MNGLIFLDSYARCRNWLVRENTWNHWCCIHTVYTNCTMSYSCILWHFGSKHLIYFSRSYVVVFFISKNEI